MPNTPNLGLPLLAAAQAQKHVTHNEALVGLDTLVQLGVVSKGLTAPPAAPAEGDRYLVAAANPAGAWSGWSGRIARFQDGQWVSYVPKPGWFAFVADENDLYTYTGSAWTSFRAVVYALTTLQNLSLLGIGTTADATNPFSAKLNKALWTAKSVAEGGTGDLRYTLNKEAPANTLSLLLQSAFSGRAEIGLTGDDDLHLKVSGDGVAWTEAVRVDRTTGGIGFLAAGTNLASAATTDLGSVASLKVDVTGTTAITSFGTAANVIKLVRFTGALTLTHNTVSLILPGAANIATAAGDTAIVTSDAAGIFRVRHYQRADGTPVSTAFASLSASGQATAALGSAAAPAWVFAGDLGTGVFSPAAGVWAVSTAGAERFRASGAGVDFANPVGTLASAATTDLGSVRTLKVDVTGTTAITSFGTGANLLRFLRFTGALTLTHNATSLILPGAAIIATAAGDTAIALSDASGNWRLYDYARADGTRVSTTLPTLTVAPASGGANVIAKKAGSGSACQFLGYNGANARWLFSLGDGAAETGGNAGSNFTVQSYTDAGAFLGSPLQIARATGNVGLGTAPAASGSDKLVVTGNILPSADNVYSAGSASLRHSTIYAGTGAISTSDAREKQLRGGPSQAELAAWADVRPQVFQFLDAVAAKGEDHARLHAGYTAQAVRDAFSAHGLDPARYALWCADPVTRVVRKTRTVERQKVESVTVEVPIVVVEDGRALQRTESRQETRPVVGRLPVYDEAGRPIPDLFHDAPVMESVEEPYDESEPTGETRLGLRYDQCLVFEAAYLRAELGALRDEVAALKARPAA